jgi:hypothetical protein
MQLQEDAPLMSFKITYHRIHVLFAIVAGINVLNMVVSRLRWPSSPVFPELLSGHLVLSLAIYGVLVAVGVMVQRRFGDRAQGGQVKMVLYGATLGTALCAVFTIVDAALTAHFGR